MSFFGKFYISKSLIFTVALIILSIPCFMWFMKTPSYFAFENWVHENPFYFFIFLVLAKTIAIVWPPLPGSVFTLGSIPIWGWFYAYISDVVGSMLGSILAFYIGKKYGFSLLEKLFGHDIAEKMRNIKVNKKRELESVIVLRLLGGGAIMEAVSYGSGLLGVRFFYFFLASLISHIILGLPTFYFAGYFVETKNYLLTIFAFGLSILVVYKLRGRYFE